MLAMIMAGGEGERLRPLTCTLPKPMTLLLDQPILSCSLALLKRHGVKSTGITLRYMPHIVTEFFGNGETEGLSLRYYTETRPMGTAGGIRAAKEFLTETFCVLSGDGVTDADLTQAYAFHKTHGALATMVLKKVKNPTQYGLVTVREDGLITGFSEKPVWSRVSGDLANTGIYILEPEILNRIPEDRPYDFGSELFPELLRQREKLYGFITDAYWCDIGDISAYMQAQRDALDGRISLFPMPESHIVRMPGAIVDEDAVIEAPAFIGSGARICRGAKILAGSVIGERAFVGEDASVKRSFLYPNSVVLDHAELRGAIVASRAVVGSYAQVFEECVIGEETRLGTRCDVKPGAKLWPGKRIPDNTTVCENVVWGQRAQRPFLGSAIRALSPEDAVHVGQALEWKLKGERVLVGRAASSIASAQEKALAAGLASQGARVYLTGECTLPQARFLVSSMNMPAGVYAEGDAITPICADESALSPAERRKIEGALARLDMPCAYTGAVHPIANAGRADLTYIGFLQSATFGSIRRIGAAVYAQSGQLLYLADQAFERAGIRVRTEWEEEMMELNENEVGIYLSASGERVCFADENGKFGEAQNEMLLAWVMAERGERQLYAPLDATRALEGLGKSLNVSVKYLPETDAEWMRALKKHSPYQFHMRFDGIFCALNVLSWLNEKELSLSAFRDRMPRVERVTREIDVEFDSRGETLRRFREHIPEEYAVHDGYYRGRHGCAWVQADEDRPVLTVTAEAGNAEFADEICGVFSGLIETARTNEQARGK